MAEVRKIQCPSCGSNSTYKLFDGNYKCNYCQGNFIVNEGETRKPASLNPAFGNPPAANPKKLVALVMGVMIVIGMAMAGFFLIRTPSVSGFSEISSQVSKKKRTIKNTRAFIGTEGSAIWIIYEQSHSLDSLSYGLLVVNPQTNKVKGKQVIVPPFKPNGTFDLSRKLGSRFWQYGDLIYTISDDNGLMAYNMYTGKTELNMQVFTEKFPELKSGILKVEYNTAENVFNITTNAGDVFKFNPFLQTINSLKVVDKTKKEQPVTQELYLSDGLKHNLYLFTKRGEGFPIVFSGYVQESRLPEPGGKKENNVKDIFGNIHIEKVSEANYFRALPLLKDTKGNLLLLYKVDLSEKSEVILESVNKEGKTNWSIQDTLLLSVGKGFASEDLACSYTFSETTLIIFLPESGQRFIAFDINTGKLLWVFSPEAWMQQNAE